MQRRIEYIGSAIVRRARMEGRLEPQRHRNPMLLYVDRFPDPIFFHLCEIRCDVERAYRAIPDVDPDKYRDISALVYLMYIAYI
jgi:hypothetical protein